MILRHIYSLHYNKGIAGYALLFIIHCVFSFTHLAGENLFDQLPTMIKYGSLVQLSHTQGFGELFSHDYFYNSPAGATGNQQVSCGKSPTYESWLNNLWVVKGPSGTGLDDINPQTGKPYRGSVVRQGSVIRLENWRAQKNLHAQEIFPSVKTSNDPIFEISASGIYGVGDLLDEWVVMILDESGLKYAVAPDNTMWTTDHRVTFLNKALSRQSSIIITSDDELKQRRFLCRTGSWFDAEKTDNPSVAGGKQCIALGLQSSLDDAWRAKVYLLPATFDTLLLPDRFTYEQKVAMKISVGITQNKSDVWMLDASAQASDRTIFRYAYSPMTQHRWIRYTIRTEAGSTINGIRDISFSADGQLYILDGSGNAYHYDIKKDTASPLLTYVASEKKETITFDTICVGNASSIWAHVRSTKSAYQLTPTGWKLQGSNLTQIAAGSDGSVFGIDTGQNVFKFEKTTWSMFKTTKLSRICVANAQTMWGLHKNYVSGKQEMYRLEGGDWQKIKRSDGVDAVGFADVSLNQLGAIFALDLVGNMYRLEDTTEFAAIQTLVQKPIVPLAAAAGLSTTTTVTANALADIRGASTSATQKIVAQQAAARTVAQQQPIQPKIEPVQQITTPVVQTPTNITPAITPSTALPSVAPVQQEPIHQQTSVQTPSVTTTVTTQIPGAQASTPSNSMSWGKQEVIPGITNAPAPSIINLPSTLPQTLPTTSEQKSPSNEVEISDQEIESDPFGQMMNIISVTQEQGIIPGLDGQKNQPSNQNIPTGSVSTPAPIQQTTTQSSSNRQRRAAGSAPAGRSGIPLSQRAGSKKYR